MLVLTLSVPCRLTSERRGGGMFRRVFSEASRATRDVSQRKGSEERPASESAPSPCRPLSPLLNDLRVPVLTDVKEADEAPPPETWALSNSCCLAGMMGEGRAENEERMPIDSVMLVRRPLRFMLVVWSSGGGDCCWLED